MPQKRKTKTMYMHTLDGQPASYDAEGWAGPYIYFVGGRHPAKLVPTLRQIRREQQAASAQAWAEWTARNPETRGEAPSDKRYDYVLVEVPS